jgi:exosortase E/protease (VPEID-CTERM system)
MIHSAPPHAVDLRSPEPQYGAPKRLALRIVWLAGLFALELIVISIRLDTQALEGRGRLIGAIADFGPHLLQSLIAFTTVFLAFGYSKAKAALVPVSDRLAGTPPGWGFLAAHAGAMTAFAFLSALLFGGAQGASGNLIACLWIASGVLGIVAALFFFVPPQALRDILRNTGSAWTYSAAAAIATPVFVIASGRLWKPATALTFQLVKLFLEPFVSTVADPVTRNLGTEKFAVQIAPGCSGLEGMGLMLVFGALWLYFFHEEYRFPRALLLIPVGMGLMFLLNSVRIAALILIGNAGAANVALGGFHSQAGWIAFNGLALGFAYAAHRVPWIAARPASATVDDRTVQNPAAPYLVPFLAILGAAMISGAISGGFEWMYPLRFVAALGALLVFRGAYSKIDWRIGWAAPAIGGLVFVIWIFLDRTAGTPGQSGIAAGLAAWTAPARIAWLVIRTLAAVITVPIAEELAFRGFLLRRLISADFESVGLRQWTWLAVAGSSVAFGLLHGDRWVAGTIAGILYACAQKWRGRIGDAVAAHAVTNAMIAVWVLWGGHWTLW